MPRKPQSQETSVRTRREIVKLLKQEGPMTAEALASHFEITAMAVRQHLYALQEEQLITYQEEHRPMGRPAKLWQLTPKSDRLFPDGYAELTLSLLNSVKQAFGEDGLDKLLEIRTRQQIKTYNQQLDQQPSLQERLETLAIIRTEEGYMADVQVRPDGSYLLVENHCPICAAATACTGLCAQELEIFQAVLGDDVKIQRVEHIIAGARRCAYQVSAGDRLTGGTRRF